MGVSERLENSLVQILASNFIDGNEDEARLAIENILSSSAPVSLAIGVMMHISANDGSENKDNVDRFVGLIRFAEGDR